MALLKFDKNPIQADFVFNKYRKSCYAGAIRAGKTIGGIARMLWLMNKMPGSRFLIGRKSFTDLYGTTLRDLFRIVGDLNGGTHDAPGPFVKRWDGQFHDLYLQDGGVIYCRHLKELETFKGLEISGYLVDQAEELDEDDKQIFSHLSSRLSWWNDERRETFKKNHGFYPKNFEILLVNPDPGWVKDLLFGNPEIQIDTRHKQWKVYETDIEHNRANLGPGYIEDLYSNHPKEWCDRFLKGSWDIRGGQIYKEYSDDIHTIDAFKIPAHWPRYMVMDWGINEYHRCVTLWFAVNEVGEIFIYRELSVTGLLASQVAERQHKLSEFDSVPRAEDGGLMGIADPAIDHRGGIVERTILDEFAIHKVYFRKANNDVMAGINKVAEVLHVNPKTGKPRLRIFKECTWTRRGFKLYVWAPGRVDGGGSDRPLKKNDDEMDTCRYGVLAVLEDVSMAAPKPAEDPKEAYNRLVLAQMRGRESLEVTGGYSSELPQEGTFMDVPLEDNFK